MRDITERIVGDLFRTIDELDVSPDEFWAAVDWLTRLGQSGQAGLITAGLGFDRLLDIRADEADIEPAATAGTPRAIEGPLYMAGAPLAKYEVRLDEGDTPRGETAGDGRAVCSASMASRWQAPPSTCGTPTSTAATRISIPSSRAYALRRRIETDAQGRYRFRSFLPPGYAIPPDSPTSELFAALGRHGNRPAHIHFLVAAPGVRTLTTQVNIPGDTFIDDDFAFATRDGLIVELEKNTPPAGYESLGVTAPFTRVRFDFVMQPAAERQRVGAAIAPGARAGVSRAPYSSSGTVMNRRTLLANAAAAICASIRRRPRSRSPTPTRASPSSGSCRSRRPARWTTSPARSANTWGASSARPS